MEDIKAALAVQRKAGMVRGKLAHSLEPGVLDSQSPPRSGHMH